MTRPHARTLPWLVLALIACSGDDEGGRDVAGDTTAATDAPSETADDATATDTTSPSEVTTDVALDVDVPDVPVPTEGGLLVPPQGRGPDAYEVGNDAGDVPVAADGRFAFGDPGPGVKVTVATPNDAADADHNVLMAVTATPPGEDPPRGILVSARTTAVALAFLTPLVATHDPHRARAILDVAGRLPEVETLAALVHVRYGDTAAPLDDPELAAARDEAVAALALAAARLPATPVGGGPRATDRAGHHVHALDPASHVEIKVEGDDVVIETRAGVPLASLFRLEQVDIDALHAIDRERLATLGSADALLLSGAHADALRSHTRCDTGASFYPRFAALPDTRRYGHTAGDSYFSRLDLAGLAVDFVFGAAWDAGAAALGLDLDPEGKLPIDTSRPGLYVVRAFNGLRGDGVDCGEEAFVRSWFGVEERGAFALNLTLVAFDVLSYVIDVRDYWGQCVADEVNRTTSGGTSFDGSFSDLWDLFADTLRSAGACVASAMLDIVGDQGEEAVIKAGKRLGRVLRAFSGKIAGATVNRLDDLVAALVKKLDPLAWGGIAGTIVDRLWTLFAGGKSLIASVTGGYFGASGLSPVDTWLVRVGDPFGPRVGTIEVGGVPTGITIARDRQVLVKTGDTVTLVGGGLTERGAPVADALLTARSGAIARVPLRFVAADRVSFVVPAGLADTVALDLVTADASARVGTVLVIEPELLGVSPRDLFRVARDGDGKPIYMIGGDYVPELTLRGRGLDPAAMVARPAGGPDGAGFVTRFGSHDQRLVLGDSSSIPTGVHTLALDTGITSPAFLAKYPDGIVESALEVRVLPAPEHTSTSPAAVANGQVFQLTGANFGTDREAVSLDVVTGPTSTLPLDVLFVIDAASGSGVQPAILSARMQHLLLDAWKDGTPDITLRLTTPAGRVELTVPAGDPPPSHLTRRVDVFEPTGWATAAAIINGTYAGADLAEVFAWTLESEPHPSGEGDVSWCAIEPGRDDWTLEADGANPVGVSRPPGIEAGGGCVRTCMWDGTWVWTGPDYQTYLYDPRNDLLDLPKTPCPSSWGGIAPAAIAQSLVAEGPFSIPPTDLYAYELGVALDVDSGGGLRFIGYDGRSKLGGHITITEPRVPDPQIPLVHLDGIENVDLRLDLRNAEACNVAVKITHAKDVRLVDPMIDGCKVGIDVSDSEGVVIQEGFVRGYGEEGIGIRVRASEGVRVTRTLVRPDRSGDGSAITTSARGVVVSDGSRGVRVTVEARKHGKGVEILDAHDVVVGGWIGAARDGSDPGTNSANVIGIDVVGPASDVTIGGNPAKGLPAGADPNASPTGETTIIADNGRVGALPGAGVRLGDVERVKVSRAYIGVVPGQMNEGNRVGIEVTAAAEDVLIERCHLGDNTVAGVDIVGATGRVTLRDVLFAAREQASWAHRRAFPTVTAGFPEAARCTLDALAEDAFDADAPPAFAPSSGGPGVRARDGASDISLERVVSLGAPLVFEASTRVRVRATDVWGAAGDGVVVSASSDVTLTGLQVWKSQGSGVLVDGSAGVRVEGCLAANGEAGLEVTGDPGPRQGGLDGGAKSMPETGSVIADPTPAEAAWRHLPALLEHGADAIVLASNTTHGLWAHAGSVPVTLSHATVVDNGGDGAHVAGYAGVTVVRGSGLGVVVVDGDTLARGNVGAGVRVTGSDGPVTIGDAQPDGGVVVSDNGGDGVAIDGADRVVVQASFIGTDASGLVAMGNAGHGVLAISARRLLIGGLPPQSNVVAGNGGDGVAIAPGVAGGPALVKQNRIGVDARAAHALPNLGHGVSIGTCVAATAPRIDGNLVAGNLGDGLVATDCDGGLVVTDNGFGFGNLGPLDQGGDNIMLVGTDGANVDHNLVRGGEHGIRLEDSDDNTVEVNLVLDVAFDGVHIEGDSHGNLVVDSLIHGSGGDGVVVRGASIANTISQNSITGSGGRAIDLRGGGNRGMPAPTITWADPREASGPGTWRVTGVVSHPGVALIELFADPDDEARVPLTPQPTFAVGGRWAFEYVAEPPPSALAPQGDLAELVLCATATDLAGNTSEVGCATIGGGAACPLGDGPPEESAREGLVVSRRDGAFALTDFTGGDHDASALAPGGGEATACGDRVVFSGGPAGARDLVMYDFGAAATVALTTGGGDDVEPSFAPGCGAVVFASDRAGAWDIHTIEVPDAGGAPAEPHALTRDAAEDREPSWRQAAGGTIVFARLGDDGWGVWQTDGGAPTVVIDGPADERDPAMHPDLDRVAYVRCDEEERCGLRAIDLELGLDGPLAPEACDDRGPAWVVAPDGGEPTLLVSRRAAGDDAPAHVVLLGPSGTPLWRMTPADTNDDAPACCLEAP